MKLSVGFCLLLCITLAASYYVPADDGEADQAPMFEAQDSQSDPLRNGAIWNYLAHQKGRRREEANPAKYYENLRLQEKRARLLG